MLHYIGHVLDSGCILYTMWRAASGIYDCAYNWAVARLTDEEE